MTELTPSTFELLRKEQAALLERIDILKRIADTVDEMRKDPRVLDLPLKHRFSPGLYTRELEVPKGAHIVTKMHRVEHQFVVSRGSFQVWEPGGEPFTITAPYHGTTKPGTIRLAIALEDSLWTNFYPTEKTDVSEIEKEIAYEPREALEIERKKWLLLQSPLA